ncbi:MAG: glutamate--tRNA ligase, partial [Flavobacteriales bacterium]
MQNVRVRFAPSPTGPLHMGGVRTALYNYLFAKKHGGTFIVRIEDTDQKRYVANAEQYIMDSLKWCGIEPDESSNNPGEVGPYRQSERKAMYQEYAELLVSKGWAYYAFDDEESIASKRTAAEAEGEKWQYDASSRKQMRNSETLEKEEVEQLLSASTKWVIRFKMPASEEINFSDLIRGDVSFNSAVLDDKVLMKGDGMPTYHLANIVDDHLM